MRVELPFAEVRRSPTPALGTSRTPGRGISRQSGARSTASFVRLDGPDDWSEHGKPGLYL
jgi:hypothetical protein